MDEHTSKPPAETRVEPPPTEHSAAETAKKFLHPWSAVLILALDWLLFGGTAVSGGFGVMLSVLWGFVLGSIGTGSIQYRLARDGRFTAAWKGLLAGLIVGAPFPIAGTAVGGIVLGLAGIDSLRGYLTRSRK